MTYNLYIQLPKPKKTPLVGTLSVIQDMQAMLFDGELVIASLERISLVWVNGHGIKLSGFEHIGAEKSGIKKYRYQEWFLAYRNDQ